MKLIHRIKAKLLERSAKKQFKKIEVDPKGICISIYCAKIIYGLLKKEEVMEPYEVELYKYYLFSNNINDVNKGWTSNDRFLTAFAYLTFTTNCHNGSYVLSQVQEAINTAVENSLK